MNWMDILGQVFELIIYPVLCLVGSYLVYLIDVKIKEAKQKINYETARKYLDMLDVTVQNAVLTTTQTYVDSLKKQGDFDAEAQKEAFRLTYEAVRKQLSDEATKYMTELVGDLETYIANKIEACVKLNKNSQ